MKKDAERYKLCLQCLDEYGQRYDGVSLPAILKNTEESIERKHEWTNPWFPFSLFLCNDCPYKLEHAVLEQGEVRDPGF